METTRCALIFLVSACLWRSSCTKFSRPDVPTRPTNHPLTPADGSTSALPQTARLSALLTQAPTVLSTVATSTQVMPRCLPVQTSACPQNWYQVDNDMCLIAMSFLQHTYPPYSRDLCSNYDGNPVLDANINTFKECLTYILPQSMLEPNDYDIRVDNNVYVDVRDGATRYYPLYNKYNVACFQSKEYFKPPTVSWFTLQIYSDSGWSLVDNTTDYFTVNKTYAYVNLTCEADGVPNPHVVITSESGNQITSGKEFRLDDYSRVEVYNCTASNFLGTSQAHRRIRILSPVSLCASEDASREMSPILGENATFSLCLMSSEGLEYSGNDTKIVVTFTRNPLTDVYWTVNITMYNIQVKDYITHTVRIQNIHGSLDVHFTLKDKAITTDVSISLGSGHTPVGQKAPRHGSLLIVLPPVCFIILMFIIVVIVWYRVKGTRISRTRSKEAVDRGSGNDDSGEVLYVNMTSVRGVPEGQEAKRQQKADRLQCQEVRNTTDTHDKESGRFITEDGLIYVTVVSANKQINKRSQGGKHPSKQKSDDESRVEYITLDFAKTGKF